MRMPLGPLQTNCYVFSNEINECVIFDPGSEGPRLNTYLKEKKLTPLAILLTHAHFDHIGGVEDVRNQWGIPVYIHRNEKKWLTSPALNGSQRFTGNEISARVADHHIEGEGDLQIGAFTLQVFETPGHSPGSVSFYSREARLVFSGDALFEGSIGRTDLQGGNHDQLLKSIHDKLLTLPEDTIVLSGHGPETTIEFEMESNPYLNGF